MTKKYPLKKTTILYLLTIGCFYLIISGYSQGPGYAGQYECTGAETGLNNSAGCRCHSSFATAGINVAIELDSAGGIPTTHYSGGMSYTVKLSGTNNTTNSQPRYGFQIGSIKGSTSQVTPTNAGTWTTPFPANTRYTAPGPYMVVGVVEHSTPLTPSYGSGGNGTIYSKTINWTAPATGTGDVSIWAALNAVNANGRDDAGDLWNTNHIVINEWPITTGIVSLEHNNVEINISPNPASNYAALDYSLEEDANIKVELYDLAGNKIRDLFSVNQNSGQHHEVLSLSEMNLKGGIYLIVMKTGYHTSSKKLIII